MASVTGGPDGTWTRRLNKPGDVLGVNPKASRLSASQGSSCQDPWPNPANVCYRFVRRYLCDQDWMGVMYPGAGMGGVFLVALRCSYGCQIEVVGGGGVVNHCWYWVARWWLW